MLETLSYLSRGGIIMIPLGLSSIIGLAIVVEKMITLRRKKILIPEIVGVIESISSRDDVNLAKNICEKHKGPFSNIVLVGLQNQHLEKEEIKEIILEQGRQEVRTLETGLPALETVAGVAPLLGLLGTVMGMIKVFNVISSQGTGQASLLAGGISEALITTTTGLVIAIPAFVLYNYFINRAENYILDIEKYSTFLLQKIREIQQN